MRRLRFITVFLILLFATFLFSQAQIKINIPLPPVLKNIIITPKPTQFNVDIWMNKPEGSSYNFGEKAYFYFKTNKNAYVAIYEIRPTGEMVLLFPNKYESDNYVQANKTYRVPSVGASYYFKVAPPAGKYYIQIIASTKSFPLMTQFKQMSLQFTFPKISDNAQSFIEGKLNIQLQSVEEWSSDMTYFFAGTVAQTGKVTFKTSPSGANIYLDGAYIGKTPKTNVTVDAGTHTITYYLTGYEPYTKTLNVQANKSYVVYASLKTARATVRFESMPTGASIYVDGSYKGHTPKDVEVSPGIHGYEIKKSGYQTKVGTFSVNAGDYKVITINLTSNKGVVVFESVPSNAKVYVNGSYKGRTPETETLNAGTYSYKITLDGYLPAEGNFTLLPGETKNISVTLTPVQQNPTVNFTSSPSGAQVFLDGVYIGNTPIQVETSAGYHEYQMLLTGYPMKSGNFTIEMGESEEINVVFAPPINKGWITVTSDPDGAMVFINGELRGVTPLNQYEVTPGIYQVVVLKPGYKVFVKTITVDPGETEEINAVLTSF
ncbi:MAG: PEGA domain-containing protein [Thermotogae bacterium]|nr:PEGA domain-containing protein [Thermotogota bacterium]